MEINNSINDKNFYEILNITSDSNTNEIKKSYKKLAIKYHPDKNNFQNNDENKYSEKFNDISNAYSILSDTDKRFIYDRFGIFGIHIYENCDNKYFKNFLLYPNSIYFVYIIFSIFFALLSCQIFLISYNLDNSISYWENRFIPLYIISFLYIIFNNIYIILNIGEIVNTTSVLYLIVSNIKSLSIILTIIFINMKLIKNTNSLLDCFTPLYVYEGICILYLIINYIKKNNSEECNYILITNIISRVFFYFMLVLKIDNDIHMNWFLTLIPLYIYVFLYVFIKSAYTLIYIETKINDNDYEKIRSFKITQNIIIVLLYFFILSELILINIKLSLNNFISYNILFLPFYVFSGFLLICCSCCLPIITNLLNNNIIEKINNDELIEINYKRIEYNL